MRRHFLILVLLIGACFIAKAQEEFDVTKHIADTKAFTFDDNKNTVQGYLSVQLTEKTKCCGKDRIYLEVKIDPSGNVLHAKAITGTNECIRRSAEDIVKNVKWDAAEFRGPTSKYLEIRPDIECTDSRDNSYTKIETFNNDLLDSDGNPRREGSAPVVKKEEPKVTTPVVKAEPVKKDPVKETKVEEKKETSIKEVATKAKDDMKEVVATNDDKMTSDSDEEKPANADESVEKETKDATRQAQEEEVIALREQLAEMRRKEIAKRRKQAAIAKKKAAYEERKRRAREKKEENSFANNSSSLYDEDPYADNGDGTGEGFGSLNGEVPKDEAIEEEIARLKEQIAELNAANEERDAAVRASLEEAKTTNQEILRIEEEIVAKEEEKERYREDQELAKLEEEKAQAEEARRAEEEAYARMMEEIKRLQEEADAKIAELEAKKKEVDKMAKLKIAREQEIALTRSLRDKEAQARLAQVRFNLQSQGTPVARIGDEASANENLMDLLPDLTTEVDSEKLAKLIQTISAMQGEIDRLRGLISSMESGGTTPKNGTAPSRIAGVTRNNPPAKTKKGGFKNAAETDDWKGFDYKQPGLEDSPIYTSVNNEQPPTNGSTPQKNPTVKNTGEDTKTGNHENSTGPKFQPREYVGGKSAMKDLIKSKLKDGGVCGLAQSVFSVTLNSSGRVIRSEVLAANSPKVKVELEPVIKGLKFNEVSTRIPQTIYLEFKAEILCEGAEKVNLKEVQDIIKK
ncbi:MAG: hypothetical protein MRZ79_14695 [Bacteroidia bacterium]|nr:hypothetical protein [Bacteroidia bacterium]